VSTAAATPGPAGGLQAVPGPETEPPRHALLLTVCCLAQFMVILDVAIVNVALPAIHHSLGFSSADLPWVVNAYTITFAGFLMLSGRAADLLGGRRTFTTGLLVFALASLAGGTAVDAGVLVGARALQGLGGAIMAASSLAIITSSFPIGPERHRAIALWGAMNGAGGAAGTLLGGIITQTLSWRWVLLINLPIGIAGALVARRVIVDRRRAIESGSFDVAGALAVTLGLLALVYGIVNAGAHGWGDPASLGAIGAGVALLAAFVVIEGRLASAPLVPLRVFRNSLLRASNITVLVFSAALFPMWYFCSLYLQEVLHFDALEAGLAFLPMSLTIMAVATQAGGLVLRFGAGRVLAAGLTLMALGLLLFARVPVHGTYVGDFLAPALLESVGIGLSVVPSTIAATATAAPNEAGLASGLVNTSRQMGGALGLAILVSVSVLFSKHLVTSHYTAPIVALNDGFRLAFAIAAGFTAIGALIAVRFIPAGLRPGAPPPLAPVQPGAPAAVADKGAASASPRPQEPSPAAPPAAAPAPVGPAATRAQAATPAAPAVPVRDGPPVAPPRAGAAPMPPARRAPAARAAGVRVMLTVNGGGSWALAPGVTTLSMHRGASGPSS
jgi:EmrB/QacA subfamily drug resistance transporter